MMRCERAQELFSDYYEGSIQPAMAIPLEGHLSTCDACRSEFDGLKGIWPVLDSAPVVEPPADFRAAVWQRIDTLEAEHAARRKPFLGIDWQSLFPKPALGWAVAALAVIMLSGFVVPGVYTPARLWLPWSAFSTTSRTAPAATVGEPMVVNGANGPVLKVRVQNPGATPIRVEVNVISGSVEKQHVSFVAPAGANGLFDVTRVTGADNADIRVQTSWQPAN
jgi:hypothetical protein